MESEELLSKLELIEEQARLTLDEHPLHLTKERQRMIISLSKHIRWLLTEASDTEATIPLPSDPRLSKLDLIEEHAHVTLAEFADRLNKERQRGILALVREIRFAAAHPELSRLVDPEATVKLSFS